MKQIAELDKRIITGALGGTLLLLIIIVGGRFGTAFLAAVISLVMVYEFTEMTFNLQDKAQKRNMLLGIAWLNAFVNAMAFRIEYELLVISFLTIFCYFLFSAERHERSYLSDHFKEFSLSLLGLLYLVFLPFYLPLIRDSARGTEWTILFFLVVWAGDTGAYFSGLKYGKRKLYPQISPKKTIEGAIGGLASGVILTLLYKIIIFRSLPWVAVLILPILIGTAAQLGDLCESFLKRAFDRKDSGALLPGHGGFLDRFDGVVFSLPVMYACVRIFG